ncbi:MAG: hypothetical protein IT364_21835 [Candidatus Hydrogenedentes bacterium]|nr:hypothetical protein [Candidatus Hydrogenedentota bacterium]
MIDRKARDEMADAVERYLREESTAFELDDSLTRIADGTDDDTVHDISKELWWCYDDNKEHKVVASKEEWDWFYRLILVLRSDGHIEIIKRTRWTARQFIACCSLVVFALVAVISGFGIPLLVVTILLGGVSMGLAYWQLCLVNGAYERSQRSLSPFSSVSELLRMRRKVDHFQKLKYPSKLHSRRIRNPIVDYVMIALIYGIMGVPLWLLCSPLALLFQAMPENCSVSTVVTSDSRMELD